MSWTTWAWVTCAHEMKNCGGRASLWYSSLSSRCTCRTGWRDNSQDCKTFHRRLFQHPKLCTGTLPLFQFIFHWKCVIRTDKLKWLSIVVAVSTRRNVTMRMIGVWNTHCHLRSGSKDKEWLRNQVPLIDTTSTRNIYVGSILWQEFQSSLHNPMSL